VLRDLDKLRGPPPGAFLHSNRLKEAQTNGHHTSPSDEREPPRFGQMHRPAIHLTIAGVAAVLGALVPLAASVGAGYYSAVQLCNTDASNLETQLTSTLLEVDARELRMKSLLGSLADDKTHRERLAKELVAIENGAQGHYGDPAFTDHALVSLVGEYNRLLRRVQFPPELRCTLGCAANGLEIDIKELHPEVETLDVTMKDPVVFSPKIDDDLNQIARQLAWHQFYAPIRRCSLQQMIYSTFSDSSEPWKLFRLVRRESPGSPQPPAPAQ